MCLVTFLDIYKANFVSENFGQTPVPLLGRNPNFCQYFLNVVFLRIICCLNTVPEGPHGHSHRMQILVQILQKVISIIMWGNDFADVTLACKYGGVFRLTKSSTLRAALDRPQNKSVKMCRNKNIKCPIDAHCHRHCRKDLRILQGLLRILGVFEESWMKSCWSQKTQHFTGQV